MVTWFQMSPAALLSQMCIYLPHKKGAGVRTMETGLWSSGTREAGLLAWGLAMFLIMGDNRTQLFQPEG